MREEEHLNKPGRIRRGTAIREELRVVARDPLGDSVKIVGFKLPTSSSLSALPPPLPPAAIAAPDLPSMSSGVSHDGGD